MTKRSTLTQRLVNKQKLLILAILFAPLLVLRAYLLANARIPMGHDTLEYLELQYTFFNEAALRGSLPQWMPFMTQGTLSNFWIMNSEGILALAITPFAFLLKSVNFLYLFEAGLLFDEFILLLGCVLLASRYFKSGAAVVFVSAAITYTAVSSTQIWWNFHVIYLLPLILYSFDRAIREASAKYLFMAFMFSTATLLGNLPYFAPPLAFGVVAFGLTILISAPRRTGRILQDFLQKISWRHVIAVAVPMVFAILILIYYKQWQTALVQENVGRTQSGITASVGQFLTYAGYTDPNKFLELLGRYSNNIDNVIYADLLTVPFCILAMFRVRSSASYAFGVTALVLASLTIGSYVAVVFYYLFPLAGIFREIGLFVPAAKPFLVFYAGFGFDAFWQTARQGRKISWKKFNARDKATFIIPIAVIAVATLLTIITAFGIYPVFNYSPWVVVTENQLYLNSAQVSSGLFALIAMDIGYLILFVFLVVSRRWAGILLILVLSVSIVDVLSFKVQSEYLQVPQVSQNAEKLFNTYNYNFSMERSQDYYSNARFTALAPYILGGISGSNLTGGGQQPYSTVGRFGALYWNTESFLYFDAEASVFRTDSLGNSINEFYRVWVPPSADVSRHLGFPIPNSISYQKATGLNYSKLQLFSAINILPNDSSIGDVLLSPSFSGDMIFANATDAHWSQISGPLIWRSGSSFPFSNQRLNGTIQVSEFSFDSLRVIVNSNSPAVLYYANAWFPNWRATVNGLPSAVIRTDLGFESIIVPPGRSTVAIFFGDWKSAAELQSIVALGLTTFCLVMYVFVKDVMRNREGIAHGWVN